MLNFFRKYQRFFFAVITVFIVISFTFYGTYNAFSQDGELPDREIAKGVRGGAIRQQQVAGLSRLLSTSVYDPLSWSGGGIPNLLNDGVIEKEFLSTGLALILSENYFDALADHLALKREKIERYRPYVNPYAPSVSVERAWQRFSPSLFEHYRQLKSCASPKESFRLMNELYVEQSFFSPDMLRELLSYQQNQQKAPFDTALARTDLSLFGFQSMEEWFGKEFIDLISQFILNAAQVAEQKGYAVSNEEVRAELFQNIYQGYQRLAPQEKLGSEEAKSYYQNQIRAFGLTESTALGLWKKVMLFRRCFSDLSSSLLVDPLAYRHFSDFAKEKASIALYELPSHLRMGDFLSLLKLQIYLEGVAADPQKLRSDLLLPRTYASLDQIEKRAPELIQRSVELSWKEIKKSDVAARLSLKETWEWQLKESSWQQLKNHFPELSSVAVAQRAAHLEKIDAELRLRIDQTSRSLMVDEAPEKIAAALEKAAPVKKRIALRSRGGSLPFAGMKESSQLIALIEKAPLGEPLAIQSFDRETYYKITPIERASQKELLTFKELLSDGTLNSLLDKQLEELYPEVRKKQPALFRQSDGSWKSFREVREVIGKYAYADLLKSIEEQYKLLVGPLPVKSEELPLPFYTKHRLLPWMTAAQRHLKEHPQDPAWIAHQEESFPSEWLLTRVEKEVERAGDLPFSKEEMFSLSTNSWSGVKVGERGSIAFFYLIDRKPFDGHPHKAVEKGQQILGRDMKRNALSRLVKQIQEKEAINLRGMDGV